MTKFWKSASPPIKNYDRTCNTRSRSLSQKAFKSIQAQVRRIIFDIIL